MRADPSPWDLVLFAGLMLWKGFGNWQEGKKACLWMIPPEARLQDGRRRSSGAVLVGAEGGLGQGCGHRGQRAVDKWRKDRPPRLSARATI